MANLPAFEKGRRATAASTATLVLALLGCTPRPAPQHATSRAEPVAGTARHRSATTPQRFVSPHSYEWFIRAELLAARGQYAAAVRAYEMTLAGAEEDPHVFSRMALALEQTGDRHGADRAITRGLALDARSEALWLARAHIAEGRGAVAEALHALERAESAAPASPRATGEMSRLLTAAGQPERALAVLERHAARLPGESAGAVRAALELALLRRDGAELAAAAQRWLATRSTDTGLLMRTIRELLDSDRAVLALRLSRVLPPTAESAPLRLEALLRTGRAAEAEALLALTPADALGGPVAVAEAYLGALRPDQALLLLGEVDEPAPLSERTQIAVLRGEALLRLGRTADAARALGQVPPGSRYAARARALLAQAAQALGRPALGAELVDSGPPVARQAR